MMQPPHNTNSAALLSRYRGWIGWQFDDVSSVRLTLQRGPFRTVLCRRGALVRESYYEPGMPRMIATVDYDGASVHVRNRKSSAVEFNPILALQFRAEVALLTNAFATLPLLKPLRGETCTTTLDEELVDLSVAPDVVIRARIRRRTGELVSAQIRVPGKIVSYQPVLGSRVTGGRIVITGWISDRELPITIRKCELNSKVFEGELPAEPTLR